MKIVLIFSILFINAEYRNLSAQSMDTARNSKILIVKINPLQLIMGEARLQMEKLINKKSSIEITLGYLYKSEYFWSGEVQTGFYNNYGIHGVGYKLGMGYKYYGKDPSEKNRTYINPLLFYKYVDFKGWDNFNFGGFGPYPNPYVTDMHYHIVALQLYYGKCTTIKRIVFDRYIGLGLRYKYGIIEIESSRPEMVIKSPRKLESWIYPSFHVGCTIGYTFKKISK